MNFLTKIVKRLYTKTIIFGFLTKKQALSKHTA